MKKIYDVALLPQPFCPYFRYSEYVYIYSQIKFGDRVWAASLICCIGDSIDENLIKANRADGKFV